MVDGGSVAVSPCRDLTFCCGFCPGYSYGLQGVPLDDTDQVLAELRTKGVTAEIDGDLDTAVRNVIKVGSSGEAPSSVTATAERPTA